MCWSCERSWRTRNVSLPAGRSGLPTATAAIFMAADTYFSCRAGETPSTSEMLSKPYAESSGGRSEVTSTLRSSRSRTAFAYSARFRRCRIGAPGFGCAAASASSAASSAACTAWYVASSGRRTPCGGIERACSLRTTFSQSSGFEPGPRGVDALERQTAGLQTLAVTADAVLVDGASGWAGRGGSDRRRLRGRSRGLGGL